VAAAPLRPRARPNRRPVGAHRALGAQPMIWLTSSDQTQF
jgi:hypothetical protein